jgi:hypothetical protein
LEETSEAVEMRNRRASTALLAALALLLLGSARSPALAEETSKLIGRWEVPSYTQAKSRMAPHCQPYAESDVQTVPDSELEIFACDDPASEQNRILEYVHSVNEVYREEKGFKPPADGKLVTK